VDKEWVESFSNLSETAKEIFHHSMNYGARRKVKTLIRDYFRDVVEQPTATEAVIAKYVSPHCIFVQQNGEVDTYDDVVEGGKIAAVPPKITLGEFIIDGDRVTVTYKDYNQAEQKEKVAVFELEQKEKVAVFKLDKGKIVHIKLYG